MTWRRGDIARLGWPWVAASCCALLAPALQAAPELVLRTAEQSGSVGKYGLQSDSGMPGICTEILRAVERVDPGLRFAGTSLRAPLRRIETMLAQDQIDAFFCLLKSPEREQQWRYLPVPLYRIRHRVVQRIDDGNEMRSLADLAERSRAKPVLVMQGTLLKQTLDRANVVTSAPPSEREALQMLLLGRTDAVYGQDIGLLRALREAHMEDRLRLSPTVFAEEFQYAVVSRHLPAEAERRLTQALQALERDGTLRALADKYR